MYKLYLYCIDSIYSLDCRCECASNVSSALLAALGGVLVMVIMTAIVVQAIVIVFFMRKLQRAKGSYVT